LRRGHQEVRAVGNPAFLAFVGTFLVRVPLREVDRAVMVVVQVELEVVVLVEFLVTAEELVADDYVLEALVVLVEVAPP
jgi:hypothetical protein